MAKKAWCPVHQARVEQFRGVCTLCYPKDIQLIADSETAALLNLFGAQTTGEKRAVYGRKTEGEA
jgi:hypothetical protein